jgi:hypothetical protein
MLAWDGSIAPVYAQLLRSDAPDNTDAEPCAARRQRDAEKNVPSFAIKVKGMKVVAFIPFVCGHGRKRALFAHTVSTLNFG